MSDNISDGQISSNPKDNAGVVRRMNQAIQESPKLDGVLSNAQPPQPSGPGFLIQLLPVLIVAALVYWLWRRRRGTGWQQSARAPIRFEMGPELARMLEASARRGEWEAIRTELQAHSYGLTDKSASVKSAFADFAAAYVVRDPMYQSVLSQVIKLVKTNPGIRQAAIYTVVKGANVEQVRYVLYYAEWVGDIRRSRKGSSYSLWPPTK